jgi:putative DNA methylase
MFSDRQLLAMQTFVKELKNLKEAWAEVGELTDYQTGVVTYLGIWVDRIAMNSTSFGLWELSRENLKTPFGRQAIPMVFDFPEGNPFIILKTG